MSAEVDTGKGGEEQKLTGMLAGRHTVTADAGLAGVFLTVDEHSGRREKRKRRKRRKRREEEQEDQEEQEEQAVGIPS